MYLRFFKSARPSHLRQPTSALSLPEWIIQVCRSFVDFFFLFVYNCLFIHTCSGYCGFNPTLLSRKDLVSQFLDSFQMSALQGIVSASESHLPQSYVLPGMAHVQSGQLWMAILTPELPRLTLTLGLQVASLLTLLNPAFFPSLPQVLVDAQLCAQLSSNMFAQKNPI